MMRGITNPLTEQFSRVSMGGFYEIMIWLKGRRIGFSLSDLLPDILPGDIFALILTPFDIRVAQLGVGGYAESDRLDRTDDGSITGSYEYGTSYWMHNDIYNKL